MQTEAQALQAKGGVGVAQAEKSHGWGSHTIEFLAVGTAIVSTEASRTIAAPTPVIDLND